jgi:hypothetical protein
MIDRDPHLQESGQHLRRPGLGHVESNQLVPAALHDLTHMAQHSGPLPHRSVGPRAFVEGPPGRRYRRPDVGDRRLGHLGDDRLGGRVDHGERVVAGPLRPCAVYVQLVRLVLGHRLLPSPAAVRLAPSEILR